MKVFHHNDNDGKCAAAMIYYAYGNHLKDTDFISCDYNKSVPSADLIEEGEEVFIVDYSFNKKTLYILKQIIAKSKKVTWLDHHLTSLEVYDEIKDFLFHCEIDMDRSGAMIAYDRFVKGTMNINIPKVVKLVDDYDRWVHKYSESIYFNLGSQLVENSPISDIWITNPNFLIRDGRIIKRYNDMKNKRICDSYAYTITINGHECIVMNTPEASSQAFAEYYDKYKFAIRYAYNGENYNYSVYSSLEDIDCSKIAKFFNPKGGGHKGAAGFVLNKKIFAKDTIFYI